jgi:hypothetical protein
MENTTNSTQFRIERYLILTRLLTNSELWTHNNFDIKFNIDT